MRHMNEQDKANILAIGGTQGDIDAWEYGDADFDFDEIAADVKGQ